MKFVKNLASKLVWKFKSFINTIKLWFATKYFCLFELFTLKLLNFTNKQVRKYIVLKGKDPDYVPPPPPLPVPPPVDPYEELLKKRKNQAVYINTGWRNEWVKDLSTHPVLKARANWVPPAKREPMLTVNEVTLGVTEDAQNPELLQVALERVVEEIKSEMVDTGAKNEEVQ